mgnify:CR=1 FL=1|tara:strand:+ start:526 stop:1071 length:546 start_codon:yes stop_codon:yes gene_type:complete
MSVSLGPNGLVQSGGTAMPLINVDYAASTNVASGTGTGTQWTALTSYNYTPKATGNLLKITVFISCGVANTGSGFMYGSLQTAIGVNNVVISTLGRSENAKSYKGNRIWYRHDNVGGASNNTHEATWREPMTSYYTAVTGEIISIQAYYLAADHTGTSSWNFGKQSWRDNKTEFLVEEFGQ